MTAAQRATVLVMAVLFAGMVAIAAALLTRPAPAPPAGWNNSQRGIVHG